MTEINERARSLYEQALVWDMVWPWSPENDNGWDRLAYFRDCGYKVLSVTLAGDSQNITDATRWVGEARRSLRSMPEVCELAESVADIRRIAGSGRLAVLLHFEGTQCFERNLDMLDVFYALGIRHTLIAFNLSNMAGGGCAEPHDSGLTAFGRRLVPAMNRVGMLLDLSHTGHRTALEAIELSDKPCVYTHSNIAALVPHYRNISDEEISLCAAGGGLVGVSGSSAYLGDQTCSTESLFAHLDYVVQLLGSSSHSALGLDVVFDCKDLNDFVRDNPDEWPAEAEPDWPGFNYAMPTQVLELVSLMLQRGYSDQDVKNILGENYARVCGEVWR